MQTHYGFLEIDLTFNIYINLSAEDEENGFHLIKIFSFFKAINSYGYTFCNVKSCYLYSTDLFPQNKSLKEIIC